MLFGEDKAPIANFNQQAETLSGAQYAVVHLLLKAGRKGLKKDELEQHSSAARKTLYDLAKKNDDWKAAIPLPGTRGKGYRIP